MHVVDRSVKGLMFSIGLAIWLTSIGAVCAQPASTRLVPAGVALDDRVLRRVSLAEALYRPLLWNYGWHLLGSRNAADALVQWSALIKARNITADWMPPTFALLLWTLGRRDEEWHRSVPGVAARVAGRGARHAGPDPAGLAG